VISRRSRISPSRSRSPADPILIADREPSDLPDLPVGRDLLDLPDLPVDVTPLDLPDLPVDVTRANPPMIAGRVR
jgi:hypothetical protein